jgi:hypothetical protein
MIHYRKETKELDVPDTIQCNRCGESFECDQFPDLTKVEHMYGYGSPKDGDRYRSDICEPCMDEIYSTFKIPPQVVYGG